MFGMSPMGGAAQGGLPPTQTAQAEPPPMPSLGGMQRPGAPPAMAGGGGMPPMQSATQGQGLPPTGTPPQNAQPLNPQMSQQMGLANALRQGQGMGMPTHGISGAPLQPSQPHPMGMPMNGMQPRRFL